VTFVATFPALELSTLLNNVTARLEFDKLYKATLARALQTPESAIQIVDRSVGPGVGSTDVFTRVLATLNATLVLTDRLQVCRFPAPHVLIGYGTTAITRRARCRREG
jgi:hypothetical protein